MEIDEKIRLVKEVGVEIINEDELKTLFENKENPVAYDGFEPSGRIHIAQGLLRAIFVNKLTKAGIKFKFWVADWFGLLNNKMGGDLEKIRITGEYFVEVWKACGMDLENVEFVWASDFIKENPEYWETVLKLSMNATVQRVLRCGQIMGREDSTSNPSAQILYPLMQAADIHHLGADIAQLGLDQRKVNMLARDIFPKLGLKPPVVVSHHMLLGLQFKETDKLIEKFEISLEEEYKIDDDTSIKVLEKNPRRKIEKGLFKQINPFIELVNDKEIKNDVINIEISHKGEKYTVSIEETQFLGLHKIGLGIAFHSLGKDDFSFIMSVKKSMSEIDRKIEMKMSKSKPDTAIFMTDSKEDIDRKFKKAYCPEGQVEDNPVLEYCKYIVFEKIDEFVVERPEKWGGNLSFKSYSELEDCFVKKELHPMDLKSATAKYIDQLIEPIRKHFEEDEKAKELLKKVESFQVTR